MVINMKTLMILRPEFFSIIIMLFLISYDRYCAKFRTEKNVYFKFALSCLGHCMFALITEITVNVAGVPAWINDICHILFFLFSLLYSLFYFEYALGLIMTKSRNKDRIMIAGYMISILAVLIMLVSPISYISGEYTRYSAGTGPTLCYMLGFILFLMADIILIVKRKQISRTTICVLIPLSFITLGLLTFQIIVPEFLYTAQALTLTAVGLFFAIENPVEKFKNRAFIDSNVQIWNRNCYEYDLEHIVAAKKVSGHRIACVIGDVNGLKSVNDHLGHLEGDKLLEKIAKIWNEKMKSAYKCYRIGGDEFIAFYFDVSMECVKKEITIVEKACGSIHMGDDLPVGISIGYAQLNENSDVDEMFKHAETMMYANKKNYYLEKGLERRSE